MLASQRTGEACATSTGFRQKLVILEIRERRPLDTTHTDEGSVESIVKRTISETFVPVDIRVGQYSWDGQQIFAHTGVAIDVGNQSANPPAQALHLREGAHVSAPSALQSQSIGYTIHVICSHQFSFGCVLSTNYSHKISALGTHDHTKQKPSANEPFPKHGGVIARVLERVCDRFLSGRELRS